MRLLLDQDVYAITAEFLKSLGHELITASDLGLARAKDTELLLRSAKENRIFVTRDKDFGGLVFVEHLGKGVILLRMIPANINAVHLELKHVFEIYSTDDLASAFVVVEAGMHRFRKLL
jgi:predicted nuclease of predicted toxin-antitoxin system